MKKLLITFIFIGLAIPFSASALLKDDLISHWKLEESSGTRVDAHTANTNDLTDNNTVLSDTGKIGTAADFERDNDEFLHISDANQTGLDVTGDYSVSAWIKMETDTLFYSILTKWKFGSSDDRSYAIYYQNDGGTRKLYVNKSTDGTSGEFKTVNATLAVGTFTHLGFVYDNTAKTFEVFINASSVGVSAAFTNAGIYNGAGDFMLGINGSIEGPSGSPMDGLMDEVSIWDRKITSDEITEIYNSGSGLPFDDWDFVEAEPTPPQSIFDFSLLTPFIDLLKRFIV